MTGALTADDAPNIPVAHPTGSGQSARGHVLLWLDENAELAADMFGLKSVDPSAAAGVIEILTGEVAGETYSVGIQPARTSGAIVTVTGHKGEGAPNIALKLAAAINDPKMPFNEAGIFGQWSPGENFCGVTNPIDNLVTLYLEPGDTDPSHLRLTNGRPALDSGPQLYLARVPPGFVPPNGSNVGQIFFVSSFLGRAGEMVAQYAGIAGNVLSNDPNTLNGELEIRVAGMDGTGNPTVLKAAGFSSNGLAMSQPDGNTLPYMGKGAIHCTELWVNGERKF